jgi:hypothetical protein
MAWEIDDTRDENGRVSAYYKGNTIEARLISYDNESNAFLEVYVISKRTASSLITENIPKDGKTWEHVFKIAKATLKGAATAYINEIKKELKQLV